MKIRIHTDTTIAEVQQKFSELYPFLKIDFYRKSKGDDSALYEAADLIDSDEKFSEIATMEQPIQIDIDPDRTVAQVESECYEKLGIAMQVSRKSGSVWLQTSKTDYRTLQMQNESGEAMSAM